MSQAGDAAHRRDERLLWQSRLKSTQTLSNRALQREKDGDLNAAYSLCIQAARAYLWLIRNSPDDNTTNNLKSISAKLLTRAEKIKARKKDVYALPVSSLDEFEQSTVLDNASVIRDRVFRPWSPQLPQDLLDGHLFSDPGGHFSLSQEQKERLVCFKRISELSDSPILMSDEADPKHIWQSCVTDCTVISSLISCLQHSKRFASSLCTSSMYPRNSENRPQYSPKGKYVARLALNGTWRAVGERAHSDTPYRCQSPDQHAEIDDYLPLGQDGSLLCAHMLPSNDFWAALLEKAFVKVHGGYLIPGSDAAADLYTFTGWIPETISLRHPKFRREHTWERLLIAFNAGRCLLSLGSGIEPIKISGDQCLASKHAFAVIGLDWDENGGRMIELIDPWVAPNRGRPMETTNSPIKLSWDTVCTEFHSLYCNWDPHPFELSESYHLKSTNQEPLLLSLQLGPSPSIDQDEIWLLLSKHTDTGAEREYLSLQVRENISSGSAAGHTVDVATEYTNSPHILVKFRPERTQAQLNVSVAKMGPRPDITYTLTVYSPCPLHLTDRSVDLPYLHHIKGRLDLKSSGGNPMHPSYIHNPHYAFVVNLQQGLQLQATLQASGNFPINLKLVKQRAEADSRILQYETCAVVADSGAYTYRTATLTLDELPMGRYCLIPSTFEPGQTTDLQIRLKTSLPVSQPTLLPAEDSGKFVRLLKGHIAAPQTDRMLGRSRYLDNPRYLIKPRQVCWLSLRLRQTPKPSVHLNASLFSELPLANRECSPIGGTGAYASYVAGVTSIPIKIRPSSSDYVLIISAAAASSFAEGQDVEYECSVFSDHPVNIDEMPQ